MGVASYEEYVAKGIDAMQKATHQGRAMLEKQQGDGVDAHSRAVDPLFVDPEHGDLRFKPESPALKMGMVPIDRSGIGLRK